MSNSGCVIVLTAPSGSGKTTIARRVLRALPAMRFSVSATTRRPRPKEKDGVDYHFLSEEEFRRRLSDGDLLEHEEVYPGLFYGTLRSEVSTSTPLKPVLLDIDVKGAERVKDAFADRALVVFVRPPSEAALARRLKKRKTESESDLASRLLRGREELTYADRFDAVVVNDDLDLAVDQTLDLIRAFLASQRVNAHD